MTQPLRTGEMNRLITVQARAASQDAAGEQVLTWATVKSVYAKMEALSGRELVNAQARVSEVSHRFTVHYDAIFADPQVAAAYRVLYGARVFDVKACLNVDEDNRVVELFADEGLNQG